ncbi:MAG: F0F1 ATP synthase subunit A [Porphyromonadaceae bacterium]|nr:F0F1 ATP synthase subunit A [Porphyromonadaceae bacterium]
MRQYSYIYGLLATFILLLSVSPLSAENSSTLPGKELNVREFILEHVADSYEWHVVGNGEKNLSVPLPVILCSKTSGWHLFSSTRFHHGETAYKGFHIAREGKYKGKIVETDASGNEMRPLDLSLTKNAASLLFASLLLVVIIMGVARSLKRNPLEAKKGFAGIMEMFVMSIHDEVIKPSVGEDYKRYAPFLLTIFFFIFTNNLLGLIPLFPGGANVTGNIAVTMVLAVATFLVVNFSGSKTYYKDILWPDVPTWLKVPIPLMPAIEIVGTLTKPFALMIRLFANIMAGHSIVLGLTTLIFITVSLGSAINASMTVLSVFFTIFIDFVELLIAYIQAYVFTLLSAVFIGQARISHASKPAVQETKPLFLKDK